MSHDVHVGSSTAGTAAATAVAPAAELKSEFHEIEWTLQFPARIVGHSTNFLKNVERADEEPRPSSLGRALSIELARELAYLSAGSRLACIFSYQHSKLLLRKALKLHC